MKIGLRKPSFKKKISSRLSIKKKVKNSLGLRAPKGYGLVTNPKKAIYNKVYNKTTISPNRAIEAVVGKIGILFTLGLFVVIIKSCT